MLKLLIDLAADRGLRLNLLIILISKQRQYRSKSRRTAAEISIDTSSTSAINEALNCMHSTRHPLLGDIRRPLSQRPRNKKYSHRAGQTSSSARAEERRRLSRQERPKAGR